MLGLLVACAPRWTPDTSIDTDTDTVVVVETDTDVPSGVDPSGGSGGDLAPGSVGTSPLGAQIRIPTSYDPSVAAPVIWLFNEPRADWEAVADADGIVLIDLQEYNDVDAIVAKLNETADLVEQGYNVDRARYYWAGWSAGGNLAIMLGAGNQDFVAGALVFPGTGGGVAQPDLRDWDGHKLRMFYACGTLDPNYDWRVVENEANTWRGYGYETAFQAVDGAPHRIDEATYGIRAAGWTWMRGFNLQN